MPWREGYNPKLPENMGEQPEKDDDPHISVANSNLGEREHNFKQDVDGIYARFSSGDAHDSLISWAIANHFGVKGSKDIDSDLSPYIEAVLTRAIDDTAVSPRAVFNASVLSRSKKNSEKTLGLSVIDKAGATIVFQIDRLGAEIEALPYRKTEAHIGEDTDTHKLSSRQKAIHSLGELANGLYDLVTLGSPEQQDSAVEYIAEASSGLVHALRSQTQDPDFYEFENKKIVDLILLHGSNEGREAVINILSEGPRPPKQVFEWLDRTSDKQEDWELGTYAQQILEKYCLEKFGLSEQEYSIMSNAWFTTRPRKTEGGSSVIKRSEIFWRNITTMRGLEATRPGSVKNLYNRYNIMTFGRYSIECLLNQLDIENKDQGGYYGVVLLPTSDWNGAFYHSKEVLDQTNQYFIEQIGSPVLRIYECQNRKQALGTLNSARKQYGPIGFSIIGGHGTRESIQFGDEFIGNQFGTNRSDKFQITIEDIERYSAIASRVAPKNGPALFAPGATLILRSCSTGQTGGMAQKLSEAFGIKVIGPDVPTSLKKLNIIKTSEGFNFEPSYADEGSEQVYLGGEKNTIKNQ